jgi:hypothetical protein
MLNLAQIEKLKKKVAKEVDIKIKNREYGEAKRKEAIRNQILLIQKDNPGKHFCICVDQGCIWYADKERLKLLPVQINLKDFDLVETVGDLSYYLPNPVVSKEHDEVIGWLKENYAVIKINAKAKNLVSMLTLGSVAEDFQKKFPTKTLLNLIEYVKAMDSLIMNFK